MKVEAKHGDVYMQSIYNPRSAEPWQRPAIEQIVRQALDITRACEGGAIYFTNDDSFSEYYAKVFEYNGTSKFRFVIVPSTRD